jgi:pimeloyl-ACP methyl ester carboxylesterase
VVTVRTLTVDGERIHVVDERTDESGVPLLLIHGFPGSSFTWHRVLPLLPRSLRAIAPDLVGLGLSDRHPLRPLTLSTHADRMVRLLDQLEIGQVDVVGVSLGGGVAQRLGLEHPGRVRRLILIASMDTSIGPPIGRGYVLELALLLGLLRVPVIGERVVSRAFRSAFHDPTKLTPEIVHGFLSPLRRRGTLGAIRRLASDMARERPTNLGAINVPTLVISAAHDLPGSGGPLARKIPGAQFLQIEEAGHAVTYEQPGAIAAAIARFVS